MKKIIIIFIIIVGIVLIGLRTHILPSLYPKQYSEYVEKYSKENDIESTWIYSIIKAESNFDSKAKSKIGAIGLMQVMPATANEICKETGIEEITEEELFEIETNIKIGTKYFKNLLEKYNNYNLALIAYNAGMGNVDKWIEDGILDKDGNNLDNIPYPETKNYVKKILKNYKIYKELY